MVTEEQARKFAENWIEAWNCHDLEQVMSHYDENVEHRFSQAFNSHN